MWFLQSRLIMNVLAMEKELKDPDEEDIKEYLSGKFMPLQRIYVPAACCKKNIWI